MIDPAIIDLMHQMSRHPPPIVQETHAQTRAAGAVASEGQGLPFGGSRAVAIGERNVRALERETARWITETERQLDALVEAFARTTIHPHHLAQLDQVVAINERMLDADAKAYGRIVKQGRRLAKQTRSVSVTLAAAFEAQRDRCLRSLARWGLARSDFIQVLRSLRAEYDPAGSAGPVFDDAKALGNYLRRAVA